MTQIICHIRIDYGDVHKTVVQSAAGTSYTKHEPPIPTFFVTVVEPDGGEIVLWSGSEYEDAMREAEAARIGWDLDEPVHDNVAGGRQ